MSLFGVSCENTNVSIWERMFSWNASLTPSRLYGDFRLLPWNVSSASYGIFENNLMVYHNWYTYLRGRCRLTPEYHSFLELLLDDISIRKLSKEVGLSRTTPSSATTTGCGRHAVFGKVPSSHLHGRVVQRIACLSFHSIFPFYFIPFHGCVSSPSLSLLLLFVPFPP